ncbi:MAG: CBS domain-containing protein [Myxococcaceae bacterium]|jgi:CBS domain-containing protein|nr:CBS domain-containing protein [Myxococcaceae bacterium]
MNVEELMNAKAFTCHPQDALKVAAELMWTHDIGCVVVVDHDGKALGMVTDRDLLMCAFLNDRALGDEPVSRAMSKELHAVRVGEPMHVAEAMMKGRQVRRLAVLDQAGKVAGVLSLNDLALAAGPKKGIKPEGVAATLASICQPRSASAAAHA